MGDTLAKDNLSFFQQQIFEYSGLRKAFAFDLSRIYTRVLYAGRCFTKQLFQEV